MEPSIHTLVCKLQFKSPPHRQQAPGGMPRVLNRAQELRLSQLMVCVLDHRDGFKDRCTACPEPIKWNKEGGNP